LRVVLRAALCVLVAAAFVVPAGVIAGKQGPKASGEKEWTMMIFWACDNNLEFTTEFCMQLWEKSLTSNEEVNIIVFVDILSQPGTWIYEIGPGSRKVVATWPEMNSSDPATLEKFVIWGENNYPAKKNLLMISDHGYGWRGICQDETNGDVLMPNDGIGNALRSSAATTKRSVDILAFDACNMGSIEAAYEMRGAARYVVASETMEPYDGLPYEMFITDMVKNPSISAEQLAKNIVYEYVLYYSDKWEYPHQMTYSQDFATMAAVDTTKMDALGTAFDAVSDALLPVIPDHIKEVDAARGYALIGTWTNMAGYEWMPDVKTFVDGLAAIDGHPELTAAIQQFDDAFDAAVIAQANSKKYHDSVHGLNFWFPPSLSQYNMQGWTWARQFVYTDVGLDLVSGTSWVDCLNAYYDSKN
jgi:hypothetical protein